jgi:LysR family nitrogen assimilation transcriptional regulator
VDTQHLKAFLKIAETGSISRAAESLGIAQPSLSQQLLRLEDEVGIRLFDRTARGVTLTEAGKIFLERAHQILQATELAIADAQHLREEARGQVVFAMPPSIARLIGAALVEALAEKAPRVKVRIVEAFHGTIRGWLEAEKIDLGILYDLGPLRHLAARHLASDELVLITPRASEEHRGEVSLAELAGRPLIAPGPQHGLRQVIDREAARAGVALDIVQEIDALDTITELVARGQGIAILPHCSVMDPVRPGALSVTHFASGGLWRGFSLMRNPSHVLTHASVQMESQTRAVIASLVAEGGWPARLQEA